MENNVFITKDTQWIFMTDMDLSLPWGWIFIEGDPLIFENCVFTEPKDKDS